MLRFIYGCMAVVILSFVAIPIYHGISTEKGDINVLADARSNAEGDLTFEEIYALASEDAATPTTAEGLNDMMPAAGDDASTDRFSSGFNGTQDSALADTPRPEAAPTNAETTHN